MAEWDNYRACLVPNHRFLCPTSWFPWWYRELWPWNQTSRIALPRCLGPGTRNRRWRSIRCPYWLQAFWPPVTSLLCRTASHWCRPTGIPPWRWGARSRWLPRSLCRTSSLLCTWTWLVKHIGPFSWRVSSAASAKESASTRRGSGHWMDRSRPSHSYFYFKNF